MTLKGGTTQACAACKFQRRKCTPECLLAPYFPSDQPKVFQNVHKLFGVSNIVKILRAMEPSQRKIAMDSLICQANIRDKYPVHGCCEEICRLRYQIRQLEEELHIVQQQLEIYRQHYHQQPAGSSITDDVTLPLFNHGPSPQGYPAMAAALPVSLQQYSYDSSVESVAYNSIYMDSKDVNISNPLWVQHPYGNNNVNATAMQSQLVPSIGQKGLEDYDEMHPIFDTIDDRQSYVYSKEAHESSTSEESMKDTRKCIEHVGENELKSAAACFSLTSVS
ncbi:hypothetical protein L6164_014629 [Bauhinia variegata]|uniref:Uncharacterized protein n=1 Tax=Bauhinia variegata TaxID=167791 RepID=A0ACB9NI40_BAUVA|nr:hypothetical protein L6164_014629 [Bauhinia variegata]